MNITVTVAQDGADALTPAQWRALFMRPWWATPLQTFAVVGGFLCLAWLGLRLNSIAAWLPIWCVQAFLLYSFMAAAHDCAHSSFLKSRLGSRIAGALWSAPVLMNFSLYKYHHLDHHRMFGPGGDGERQNTFKYLHNYILTIPYVARQYLLSFGKMSWDAAFGRFPRFAGSDAARADIKIDNFVLLGWALLACIATALWPLTMLPAYWIPMVLYYPAVFFISSPEHLLCLENHNAYTNTRIIRTDPITSFLIWHTNYHGAHHVHPGVPSWNLRKLDAVIGGGFMFRENSYVGFHAKLIGALLPPTWARFRKVYLGL